MRSLVLSGWKSASGEIRNLCDRKHFTGIWTDRGSYWWLSWVPPYCWVEKHYWFITKTKNSITSVFWAQGASSHYKSVPCFPTVFLACKKWHCLVIWDYPKMLCSASSQHQIWRRYSANTQPICHRASWSSGEKQDIYLFISDCYGVSAIFQLQFGVYNNASCSGSGVQHPSFSHKWQWLPNSCHIIALPARTHAALKNNINWSNRKTAHCDVARFSISNLRLNAFCRGTCSRFRDLLSSRRRWQMAGNNKRE